MGRPPRPMHLESPVYRRRARAGHATARSRRVQRPIAKAWESGLLREASRAMASTCLAVATFMCATAGPAPGTSSLHRGLQAAQMAGGRPPHDIEVDPCSVQDVFAHLQEIKSDPNCRSGCSGGSGVCPPDWYPSEADECSALCGAVYEPFWVRHFILHPLTAIICHALGCRSNAVRRAWAERHSRMHVLRHAGSMWPDAHGVRHGGHERNGHLLRSLSPSAVPTRLVWHLLQ